MGLYDDVLADMGKDNSESARYNVKLLKQATVVRADNVLRYYAEDVDDAASFMRLLGVITPPMPVMWVEMNHAATYRFESMVMDWPDAFFQRVGALIMCNDAPADNPAGARWTITMAFFFEMNPRMFRIQSRPGASMYPVLFHRAVLDADGVEMFQDYDLQQLNPQAPLEILAYLSGSIAIARDALTLTLSFLNCKNTALDATTPPRPPQTPEQRRHNIWPVPEHAYHLIQVDALGGPRGAEGTATGAPGSAQRLHIVRGHFRVYTAEKPLFGKLVGKYWIRQHTQGTAPGVIDSSYEVDI